jgi:hypothetical protein
VNGPTSSRPKPAMGNHGTMSGVGAPPRRPRTAVRRSGPVPRSKPGGTSNMLLGSPQLGRFCRADSHLCDRRILTSAPDRSSNIDPSKGERDAVTGDVSKVANQVEGHHAPQIGARVGYAVNGALPADRPPGRLDRERQVGGPVRCPANLGQGQPSSSRAPTSLPPCCSTPVAGCSLRPGGVESG